MKGERRNHKIRYNKRENDIIANCHTIKVITHYFETQEISKMKEFFDKPQVKNVLLAIPGVLIGLFAPDFSNIGNDTKTFWMSVACIVLLVVYIFLLIYYSTAEVNERRIKKILEERIKTYEEIMMGVDNICKESASGVNAVIHSIIEKGNFNPNIWNFDKACMLVCSQLYALLCNLSGGKKDFRVNYVRLEEDVHPEVEIRMSGFANQNMLRPTIFGKKRRIDKADDRAYHDVELFRLGKSDIEVVLGPDKIDDSFSYTTKESRSKNRGKYSQYVAIPVFCNDTKMVGLLQIMSLNGVCIGQNEKEVLELASKYFVPYSYLLLLLHKIEKAVLAKPKD